MKRISIQIKVIAMIVAVGIVLVATLSMMTGVFFRRVVDNQIIPITENAVENLALNLNMQTYNYLSTLKQVASSSAVINLAKKDYHSVNDKTHAMNELQIQLTDTNVHERVIWPFTCLLMTKDGTLLSPDSYSHDNNRLEKVRQVIVEESYYQKMMNRSIESFWIGIQDDVISNNDRQQLFVVQNIVEKRNPVGLVIFCVDLIYLESLLQSGKVTEHSLALLFQGDGTLIAGDIQEGWQIEGFLAEIQKNSGADPYIELNGKQYVLMTEDINVLGTNEIWTLSMLTPANELMQELHNVQILAYAIGAVVVLAVVLIIIYLNRAILRPVVYYGDKVNEIGTDNFDVVVDVVGRNEMKDLGSGLNTMINRIKKGVEDLKQREDTLRKLEIQSLSAQINPHFIRNTLNSIRTMAEIANVPVLAEAIRSFTKLIDYIFHGNRESTVGAELSCSKDYVNLQNLRYQNKFYFSIDVDESLMNEKMPALIFQPIVENCITHGFWGRKGSGEIKLTGREKDGIMIFSVADDGVGIINTDVLERKDKASHGLSNTHNRIKLLYGEEYGLTIRRGEICGTVVEVKIPKGGYSRAESYDCG